jgi:hypothetical protein
MPRLRINLPNLTTLEEWEEIEPYQRQTTQQKQPRRPDNIRNEAQERRLFERRKYHRRAAGGVSHEHP